MIYASQNLYGIIVIDRNAVVDTWKLDILCNGIATDGKHIYLGDWSAILKLSMTGEPIDSIQVPGYDNIHTVNLWRDELLVSSTSNDSVYLGKERIFNSKEQGFKTFTYVNSAIPFRDATILISQRNPKNVILFDVDKRKIEKIIRLPYLHNQHHPIAYTDDLFLVSDGDGIIMFDADGKAIRKSPPMAWPRGIKVIGRTKVICVDRSSIMVWNPVTNILNMRIETPIQKPNAVAKHDDIGGALFDLVVV